MRAIGDGLTPALAAKLRELDLDPEKPLPPAWPAERLGQWLDCISDELFPGQPRERSHRELGWRFVDGWRHTVIGGATVQLLRIIGARRALVRLTRAFRTGDNFTDVDCEFTGPTTAFISLRTQPLGDFVLGQLERGMPVIGVKKGTVTQHPAPPGTLRFQIDWEE